MATPGDRACPAVTPSVTESGDGVPVCHDANSPSLGWSLSQQRASRPSFHFAFCSAGTEVPPGCPGNEFAGSQPLLERLLLPYEEAIPFSLASFLGRLGGWG